MDRIIKFRGIKKSPYGDRWVYGYYTLLDGKHVIIMPHSKDYEESLRNGKPLPPISINHEVDKETIGQFTGLLDKNGVEIYEGDIVKVFTGGKWRIAQVIYEYSVFTIDVTNNKDLEYGRISIIERFTEVIRKYS